jgi:hypothetical protein
MKPARTFPSTPADNREWTRYLQQMFYAREWTTELSGIVAPSTGIARYTVSAGIVCLSLPQLSGTSNSALAFLESLPAEITPEHDQVCLARITDNGVTTVGIVHIGTDTGITLYKNTAGDAFTASGTKAVLSCVITYPLD